MNNENSISSNYDETPLKKGNVYQRIVDDHDEDETRSKDNPYRVDDEDEDVSSNNEVTLYTSHLIIQVLLNI